MGLLKVTFLLILIQQTICDIPATCSRKVTVQSGTYCWSTANDNNISLDHLLSLNPGLDCDTLQIGQDICVSQASEKVPSTMATNSNFISKEESCQLVNVKPGDTCWSISSANDITIAELQELNPPGINCDLLQVDQEICIGIYVEITSKGFTVLKV